MTHNSLSYLANEAYGICKTALQATYASLTPITINQLAFGSFNNIMEVLKALSEGALIIYIR